MDSELSSELESSLSLPSSSESSSAGMPPAPEEAFPRLPTLRPFSFQVVVALQSNSLPHHHKVWRPELQDPFHLGREDRTRKGPFWWPGISPTYDTTSPPAPKGKVSLWFFPREVVTVT